MTEQNLQVVDALDRSLAGSRTYEQIVADGAAIERLLQDSDFKRYQRLLSESYVALVDRTHLMDKDDFQMMVGAQMQHKMIMKLPAKLVDMAAQQVQNKRTLSEVRGQQGE